MYKSEHVNLHKPSNNNEHFFTGPLKNFGQMPLQNTTGGLERKQELQTNLYNLQFSFNWTTFHELYSTLAGYCKIVKPQGTRSGSRQKPVWMGRTKVHQFSYRTRLLLPAYQLNNDKTISYTVKCTVM